MKFYEVVLLHNMTYIFFCNVVDYFLPRLEILDYQELNAIPLYLEVCEEPFHGWHQSCWMGIAVVFLKR